MTITYPRTDIMTMVEYSPNTAALQLVLQQEVSRSANGKPWGKDLGDPYWSGAWTTVALGNDDAVAFEAALRSLDGLIGTFEAGEVRKRLPRLHPDGVFTDTTVLQSLNVNNKALSISGASAGFKISVGDFLHFDFGGLRALHEAMEPATANGAGVTPEFEVRPYIRPGATVGTAVVFRNPCGIFSLTPGSVQPAQSGNLTGAVTFQATQII